MLGGMRVWLEVDAAGRDSGGLCVVVFDVCGGAFHRGNFSSQSAMWVEVGGGNGKWCSAFGCLWVLLVALGCWQSPLTPRGASDGSVCVDKLTSFLFDVRSDVSHTQSRRCDTSEAFM